MEAQEAGAVHPKGTDGLSKQLMAIASEKDAENQNDPGPDEDGAYDVEVVEETASREPASWPAATAPGAGVRR